MRRLLYFAYGSNMCTGWLRARVSSAVPHGVALLGGHSLKWHKRSKDGSAKCDAYETGNDHDQVLGVLFALDVAQKPSLDRAEGVGRGYLEKAVRVEAAKGLIDAFTYVAEADAIDSDLLPYDWYKDLVIRGARAHSVTESYVEILEHQPSRPDADATRHDLADVQC